MASHQELTKTQHAVDATDDDDITADDAPLLGLSEEHHPAPPPPPYGVQNKNPWIANQPPTQYVFMEQPRTTQATMVQYEDVESYLPLSIFVCLCCFWPLGLWAIFKSNESKTLASVGRYPEARQKAREARTINIIGIIIGVIILAIFISIYVWVMHMTEKLLDFSLDQFKNLNLTVDAEPWSVAQSRDQDLLYTTGGN